MIVNAPPAFELPILFAQQMAKLLCGRAHWCLGEQNFFPEGAIQVLRNAVGGAIFPRKHEQHYSILMTAETINMSLNICSKSDVEVPVIYDTNEKCWPLPNMSTVKTDTLTFAGSV